MSVRLLLVDDHQMFREGLRSLLDDHPDMEVVGESEDGEEAATLVGEVRPDVVLMDVTIRGMDGVAATQAIRAEFPEVKVIALSMHTQQSAVTSMLEAGASGYVVKGSPFQGLVEAVQAVQKGETYVSPSVAGMMVRSMVQPGTGPRQVGRPSLSPRQREVLCMLAEGKTAKETAFKMNISTRTVETHRHQIMQRLGIDSIAGLTKYAIMAGLSALEV